MLVKQLANSLDMTHKSPKFHASVGLPDHAQEIGKVVGHIYRSSSSVRASLAPSKYFSNARWNNDSFGATL